MDSAYVSIVLIRKLNIVMCNEKKKSIYRCDPYLIDFLDVIFPEVTREEFRFFSPI
jgi:hypothetical protein